MMGENSGSSDSFWYGDDRRLVAVAYDDESGPAIGLAPNKVPGQGAFVELTIERRHGDSAIRTWHHVAPERSAFLI